MIVFDEVGIQANWSSSTEVPAAFFLVPISTQVYLNRNHYCWSEINVPGFTLSIFSPEELQLIVVPDMFLDLF